MRRPNEKVMLMLLDAVGFKLKHYLSWGPWDKEDRDEVRTVIRTFEYLEKLDLHGIDTSHLAADIDSAKVELENWRTSAQMEG